MTLTKTETKILAALQASRSYATEGRREWTTALQMAQRGLIQAQPITETYYKSNNYGSKRMQHCTVICTVA